MDEMPAETVAPRPLWRNRDFRLLFGAQVVSLLGSGVTTVGLALFAYQLTGGTSATAVIGNALTLRILAFLLFSQPAGVIADRASRKKILISADLLRFGLLALFPFITAVWQIYALIFVINAVTAFFTPTFEASVPEVAGNEQYVRALSYSRVAVDVEAVAGPAVAGLLVALLGVRWVFWFDAFTYLVSALLVAAAVVPRVTRGITPLSWRAFLTEITHGSRVLLREPALRQALTLSFAEATAGAAAIVATVAYVRDALGRGETAFAMVMAGLGLGSTLAAVMLGRATGRYERGANDRAVLHGRRHRWTARALLLGGLLLGLLLLPGVLMPSLFVFGLLWILNGVGQALIAISSSTLLAEHTVAEERGRAYAAHFALTHACWLITYPAVGHAAAKWGAPVTFTAAGVVCLLITAAAKIFGQDAPGTHTHT
jgi:MFS transporter, NRE family, putaive nickel resistance protein